MRGARCVEGARSSGLPVTLALSAEQPAQLPNNEHLASKRGRRTRITTAHECPRKTVAAATWEKIAAACGTSAAERFPCHAVSAVRPPRYGVRQHGHVGAAAAAAAGSAAAARTAANAAHKPAPAASATSQSNGFALGCPRCAAQGHRCSADVARALTCACALPVLPHTIPSPHHHTPPQQQPSDIRPPCPTHPTHILSQPRTYPFRQSCAPTLHQHCRPRAPRARQAPEAPRKRSSGKAWLCTAFQRVQASDTCMHACMHVFMNSYIHTYIHAYMHTYTHTHIHTYIRTNMHRYIQVPYVHTYILPYIHTHIQVPYACRLKPARARRRKKTSTKSTMRLARSSSSPCLRPTAQPTRHAILSHSLPSLPQPCAPLHPTPYTLHPTTKSVPQALNLLQSLKAILQPKPYTLHPAP